MPQRHQLRHLIPKKRQWRPRKIKRIPLLIQYHLHHIRIPHQPRLPNRRRRRDHRYPPIPSHRHRQLINQPRRYQWLIPLHIDQYSMPRKQPRRLGNAIRPTRMLRRCHHHPRPKRLPSLHNPLIIRRDDNVIHLPTVLTSLPHMLHQRLPRDQMQRLPRKPGRSPTGRYGHKCACRFSQNNLQSPDFTKIPPPTQPDSLHSPPH